MRLEDIKQLNEAGYAGRVVYFVQAFDPEDGDISTYAGPFDKKSLAENFAHNMARRDEREFGESVDMNDLPSYNVEQLLSESQFAEAMYNHVKVFAN